MASFGLVADRAHKAKFASPWALCAEIIAMRARVAELPGGEWAHITCAVRQEPGPDPAISNREASRFAPGLASLAAGGR